MVRHHDLQGGVNTPWQELREVSVLNRRRLTPKTANQGKYLAAIDRSVVTLCVGPAGTGKTWLACGKAVELLRAGKVDQIVISRPLVQCDEDTGFLKGDLAEKTDPFVQPMLDAFADHLDRRELGEFFARGVIKTLPLALMRGRSLPKSFIILDEAQNATARQLRMFLTRFGVGSKVVLNGDHTQSDLVLPTGVPLFNAIQKMEGRGSLRNQPISIVRLTRADIVRHPFIQWLDETLTGDYVEDDLKQEARAWETCRCPRCSEQLWFPGDEDLVVECWSCKEWVEGFNEAGEFDPVGVDKESGVKPGRTYAYRP